MIGLTNASKFLSRVLPNSYYNIYVISEFLLRKIIYSSYHTYGTLTQDDQKSTDPNL